MAKINGSAFTTGEHEDFTHKRDASIKKDHVILFTYTNGNTQNPEDAMKGASKELTALCPYNFLEGTEYLAYQTVTDNNIITKIQYTPLIRVPKDQRFPSTGRFTTARPSAGPSAEGRRDTILTADPVANAEFTNTAGVFTGGGLNNLDEKEMDTLTQKMDDGTP
jgi:hypothetical protein